MALSDSFQNTDCNIWSILFIVRVKSAIDLSKNFMYHARTKHINMRYHWICEQVESESFHVNKIHTSENYIDMLTKIIPKDKLELSKELVCLTSL